MVCSRKIYQKREEFEIISLKSKIDINSSQRHEQFRSSITIWTLSPPMWAVSSWWPHKSGGGGGQPRPDCDFSPGPRPWFHLNSELNGGTFGPLEMLENMNWHTTTPASGNNILCFILSRFVENYFLRKPPALKNDGTDQFVSGK